MQDIIPPPRERKPQHLSSATRIPVTRTKPPIKPPSRPVVGAPVRPPVSSVAKPMPKPEPKPTPKAPEPPNELSKSDEKPKPKLPVLKETPEPEPTMGGKVKPAWYRRFSTWVFATLTLIIILALNIAIWVNRAIISHSGFVATFAPLSDNASVQEKLSSSLADKILDSAEPQEFAAKLLPTASPGTSDAELRKELHPVVQAAIAKAVKSPHFGAAWREALGSVHDAAITNSAGTSPVSINLKPVLNDVLDSLKGTSLAFIADEHRDEVLKGDAGNVKLDNSKGLTTFRKVVNKAKQAPLLLSGALLLSLAIALLISPYRFKTLRKIVLFASLNLAVMAALILGCKPVVSHFIKSDARDLALAAVPQVLRGLVMQSIILATVGLFVWFILYILHRTRFSRVS